MQPNANKIKRNNTTHKIKYEEIVLMPSLYLDIDHAMKLQFFHCFLCCIALTSFQIRCIDVHHFMSSVLRRVFTVVRLVYCNLQIFTLSLRNGILEAFFKTIVMRIVLLPNREEIYIYSQRID